MLSAFATYQQERYHTSFHSSSTSLSSIMSTEPQQEQQDGEGACPVSFSNERLDKEQQQEYFPSYNEKLEESVTSSTDLMMSDDEDSTIDSSCLPPPPPTTTTTTRKRNLDASPCMPRRIRSKPRLHHQHARADCKPQLPKRGRSSSHYGSKTKLNRVTSIFLTYNNKKQQQQQQEEKHEINVDSSCSSSAVDPPLATSATSNFVWSREDSILDKTVSAQKSSSAAAVKACLLSATAISSSPPSRPSTLSERATSLDSLTHGNTRRLSRRNPSLTTSSCSSSIPTSHHPSVGTELAAFAQMKVRSSMRLSSSSSP